METPAPAPVAAKMPTFGRIIRCLFSWRMLRCCLVVLAVLVTLIALFYTEEAWRGKRAWERYRSQEVAEGMQMELKAYLPPPVPDDQNFAMTPFLAPLFDFNPQPLQPGQTAWRDTNGFSRVTTFGQQVLFDNAKMVFPNFNQKLDLQALLQHLQLQSNSSAPALVFASRADAAAEVLKQFAPYQPVLDELRTASRRPYSRFNINYDEEDPASILLPHLAVVRRIETVLAYQSSAELATGKSDAAFDDVEMMIFLARSIQTEPFVISHLVRIFLLNQVAGIIREGLAGHLWSDGQLQRFQMQLEALTLLKDLEPCLNAERVAMGNVTFELLRKGRPNYFSGELGGSGPVFNAMWLFPDGWSYFEQLNYNLMLDDQLKAGYDSKAGVVHPQTIEAGQQKVQDLLAVGGWSKIWNHRLFAGEMLPFTAGIIQKSACAQTAMEETALACALERFHLTHGNYPESLAALEPQFIAPIPQDVITGEPLKYRLTDDGQFILYSVGWNETDDGGQIVMSKDGKTVDVTQGDWVWPAYSSK